MVVFPQFPLLYSAKKNLSDYNIEVGAQACSAQLKGAFTRLGYQVYGGEHAPYLWVHAPKQPLWEAFEYFLKEKQLIVTPGIGFGPSGKDFFRVSAFLKEEQLSGVLDRLSC